MHMTYLNKKRLSPFSGKKTNVVQTIRSTAQIVCALFLKSNHVCQSPCNNTFPISSIVHTVLSLPSNPSLKLNGKLRIHGDVVRDLSLVQLPQNPVSHKLF